MRIKRARPRRKPGAESARRSAAEPTAPRRSTAEPTTRVCPNCAFIADEPLERCPRCEARMSIEREENVADKASADSFPASDPPQH